MDEETDKSKLREIEDAWVKVQASAEACLEGSAATKGADEGRVSDALGELLAVLDRVFGGNA